MTKHLASNTAAEQAMPKFKVASTTAPIFMHFDPARPFSVVLDASEMGVGTVLLQS